MNSIDIRKIDLNLLTALELLLTELNVTRAARRAGVTQSSMSHTLRKLRTLFKDELLVRAGRGTVLTPRAASLVHPLKKALHEVSDLVNGEERFIPEKSRRVFIVGCPDLFGAVLPNLLSELAQCAPFVRLDIRPLPTIDLAAALLDGGYDLILTNPPCESPGLIQQSIGKFSWAVVARKGHPARESSFTQKVWSAYPHVIVRSGRSTPNVVGGVLSSSGLSREIGLTVPGFLFALQAVAHTNFFFTAPRELVEPLAESFGLVMFTPPLALPKVEALAVWHEQMQGDPGHQWFRSMIGRVVSKH